MNVSNVASTRAPWSPPGLVSFGAFGSFLAELAVVLRPAFWPQTPGAQTARAILKPLQRDDASKPALMAADGLQPVARSGSTPAYDVLARFQRDIVPHLDAAYNFARFLSRNADVADDIVQDAFLRAYRDFGGYEGGDARAWIFSIVRNCYYDWLKARRRKARVEFDGHGNGEPDRVAIENVPSTEDTPEAAMLRQSEAMTIRGVLNSLPRGLREMLVLRELEGLSYFQIAQISTVPIGTVMSRLARARKQFQNAWRAEINRQQTNRRESST